MKAIHVFRLVILALATAPLLACSSPPDGVVDDTNKVAMVPVTIAGDDVTYAALVTSDRTAPVYQAWSRMQSLIAAEPAGRTSFRGFRVVEAPYDQKLLVPPEPLGSSGWFIVCDAASYMQSHGACIVAGKVGASVVQFTAWTSDIGRFRAIVDGLTDAVEKRL